MANSPFDQGTRLSDTTTSTSQPTAPQTGHTDGRPRSKSDTDQWEKNKDNATSRDATADGRAWAWLGASPGTLVQGLLFGLVFGFLLQKGGVAKFDILLGVLLLEDFTVVKVMGTAIVVGMIGVYLLIRVGMVQPQVKETVYSANIVGGLIFGVGFGLLAYCPGTNAAAVGQGNTDALVGVAGLTLGAYLFALNAEFTTSPAGTVTQKGSRGKLTLPDLLGLSRGVFLLVAVPVLVVALILVETFL